MTYSKRKFNKFVKYIRSRFDDEQAITHWVTSIIHSEFPFMPGEYVFLFTDDGIERDDNITQERLKTLEDFFSLNEDADEKTKDAVYLRLANANNSVTINTFRDAIYFHTHPADGARTLEERPGFSAADLRTAQKVPVGLIEYVLTPRNNSLFVTSRASLAFKKWGNLFLNANVDFREDGTYVFSAKHMRYEDNVPYIGRVQSATDGPFSHLRFGPVLNYISTHCFEVMSQEEHDKLAKEISSNFEKKYIK